MMHRLSGSKLKLAMSCLYWAREDVALPARESSAAADAGTNKHTILEKLFVGEALPDEEFQKLWDCDPRDVAAIQDNIQTWLPSLTAGCTEAITEIPLAYHPITDTARELPRGGHREYVGLRSGEIPLTLDLVAVYADGTGLVVDHKTGRQNGLEPAAVSAQLGLGALALARLRNLTSVRVAYTLVNDDGTVRIDEAVLDTFDLEALADEVRGIVERLDNFPVPCPGPWCKSKFCPARSVCPVTSVTVAKTEALAPLSVTIESPQHCTKLHTQLGLAEEFLARVRAAIDLYVKDHGPIELGDGTALDLVHKTRETLDIDGNNKALEILQKALGPAYERAVTMKVSTTKEAVRAATALLAKGKDRTALERQLLADLAYSGAIKVGSYEKVEVTRPAKGRGA